MMVGAEFDDIALAYDYSIDWEERLRREIPFIVDAVENLDGKRILDLACGTGRHVIEFDKRGAAAKGIDNSSNMIRKARDIAERSGSDAEFMVADMRDMKKSVSGNFDLVLCLGNSLALLPDFEAVRQVASDVHDVLIPDGIFLYQILNFESITQSDLHLISPKGGKSPAGDDLVFFRFLDHVEDSCYSKLILSVFEKRDKEWQVDLEIIQVLRLNSGLVQEAMDLVGFHDMKFYSSYDSTPFDRTSHRNLIVTARK